MLFCHDHDYVRNCSLVYSNIDISKNAPGIRCSRLKIDIYIVVWFDTEKEQIEGTVVDFFGQNILTLISPISQC